MEGIFILGILFLVAIVYYGQKLYFRMTERGKAWITCYRCNGKGSIRGEGYGTNGVEIWPLYETCPICKGRGKVEDFPAKPIIQKPPEVEVTQDQIRSAQNKLVEIDLLEFIGQNIKGDQFQKFLREIGISPTVSKPDPKYFEQDPSKYYYFYNFNHLGFGFNIRTSGDIITVHLYSEDADYRQYQGKLPCGLSFAMTRQEVESILGLPDSVAGTYDVNATYYRESKKIIVNYESDIAEDFDAQIRDMTLNGGEKSNNMSERIHRVTVMS
jgi:hypothetical protein